MPGRLSSSNWRWDIATAATVASPVVIFLIGYVFHGLPALDELLDGKEVLEQGRANYVRNLFELSSFIATTAILITALFAFVFSRTQIKEARDTRLATLYAALEGRWSSKDMIESRNAFSKMRLAYRKARAQAIAGSSAVPSEPDFVKAYLNDLETANYSEFASAVSLLDYLEYIGMLERKGYLDIDDIEYILGSVCIEVYSIMSSYIGDLRRSLKTREQHAGLINVPDAYECFSVLTRKFVDRFQRAP